MNGLLCLGVVLGGFVAGTLQARANGDALESTRGLLLGARVGLISALLVMAFDLFVTYVPFGGATRAGVDYLDPIPKYIYLTIYGIYDGMLDIVRRGEAADGLQWPGRIARYIILTGSTVLFGGMGGGIAASTFISEPVLANMPERRGVTPRPSRQMPHAPAQAIQFQAAQQAVIFPAPGEVVPGQRSTVATGTHGPPVWQRVGVDRAPMFDQAAQLQQASRPRETISVASPGGTEPSVIAKTD